jgi:hypothetical protein
MGNEIRIIIGGDPSGLVNATREVNNSLGRMRDAVGGPAGALPKLDNAASKAAESLKNQIVPGAKQASTALLGFNRVIQDAPFGLVAIGNNLTEIPGALQNLSVAAKESGQSVGKLLISSLMGPAGLGIALSVVTSALTFATVGFEAWTRGFGKSKEEIDKAQKKLDEFIKSLKSVGEVSGEAAASQDGQIAQVRALAAVVQDTNKSYESRKRALEELKQTNKSYFGDLKLEESQMGALTTKVNEYTQALIAQAVLKGFTEEISRVSVELAKQKRVLGEYQRALDKANVTLANTKESQTSLTGEDRVSQAFINAKKAVLDANSAFIKQFNAVGELRKNYDLLNGEIDGAVQETLKFKDLTNPGKEKAEVDLLKKRLEALEKIKDVTKDVTALVGLQESIFELQVKIAIRDQGKNQISKAELDQQVIGFKSELQAAFDKQALELEAIPKIKLSQVQLADTSQRDISSVIAKATGLDKKIVIPTQYDIDLKFNGKEFADNALRIAAQIKGVTDALFNGIVNGIQQGASLLGEAIGNILSGGDVTDSLAKAAQGMLSIVGDILQAVGKELIITSQLVATLKQAINNLFKPGGEIAGLAVGALLIASGAILKNIQFDVPKLAKGGIATGPTLGIFGEAGKEAIIPLDRLPDIIGKLSMNSNANVTLAPSFRISLTDLELGLERVRKSRGRLG